MWDVTLTLACSPSFVAAVLFDWDNLFLAYMASLIDRDLAYSNAIQIIKAKTVAGFVPNYSR